MPGSADILEPGERVIARDPPRWVAWAVFAFFALPVLALAVTALREDPQIPADWWERYTIVFALGLGNAVLALMLLRWRLLVTDRRAIVRKGFFSTRLTQMRLDEVREVRSLAFGLLLRGREREIHVQRILAFPLPAAALRMLEPAYGAGSSGKGRLDSGLAPGETVLKRAGRPWGVIANVAAGVGGMAALLLSMSWDKLVAEPDRILPVAGLLLFIGVFFGGVAWFAVAARRDRWLVTDRRIRVARGPWRCAVEEMMLEDVETARFSGDFLNLRGGGKVLDIRGARMPADLLHRLLPRQFPTKGARAARLDRLLQPGERLLLRRPGRWADWMPWIAGVILAVGFAAVLLIPSFFGKPLTGKLVLVAAIIPALALPGTLLENRHGGWTVAVTDRRLLRRLDHDPAHYDAIETHRIKGIRYLPEKRGLAIRLDDRVLDIIADPKTADRILAALGRTAEDRI